MTILDDIIAYKRDEVSAAKANAPLSAIEALAKKAPAPRGFKRALETAAANRYALIAEIKKASPSKGLIRADFDPDAIARAYEAAGATCLSVLTDGPSFQGSPDYLRMARVATTLPVLRKDFMIDPYQIVEARSWGADCILLIMANLTDAAAAELHDCAKAWGMDALVEVHDADELARAQDLGADFIGVNNRNLKTFVTDLKTTVELAAITPPNAFLVSESGISTPRDLEMLSAAGAKAFLIGETLMRQDDVKAATRALIGTNRFA